MIDTKNRILNSAEILFAEHGFNETSLRIITSVADVNLAAVNYHFGSKKILIQAVIDRYFISFTEYLEKEFAKYENSEKKLTTRALLESLVEPILKLNEIRPEGASTFMRLLGRAYTESQGHLKLFLTEKYGYLLIQFTVLVNQANPELDSREMFWRLHFMLGTFVFALAGQRALSDIAEADFNEKVDVTGIVHHLIPFLTAAMQPTLTEPSLIESL
ncbi:MAG: TetR family transcriptional regulator [Gammaproteobacteria bacterium]|nr:MAG: TetR family transcriptional regulator [Gammaproteobacteria bacterium]